MKFKRNITITIGCKFNGFILNMLMMSPLIALSSLDSYTEELLIIVRCLAHIMAFVDAILILVFLISYLCMDTSYKVKKVAIVIQEGSYVRQIEYEYISHIDYNFGEVSRYKFQSSEIILYNHRGFPMLTIKNPSLIMVYKIIRHCKGKKINYKNAKSILKFYLYLDILLLLICLFSLLLKS